MLTKDIEGPLTECLSYRIESTKIKSTVLPSMTMASFTSKGQRVYQHCSLARDGQRWRMLCSATRRFRELKALLASTNRMASVSSWAWAVCTAVSVPEIWPAQSCIDPVASCLSPLVIVRMALAMIRLEVPDSYRTYSWAFIKGYYPACQ